MRKSIAIAVAVTFAVATTGASVTAERAGGDVIHIDASGEVVDCDAGGSLVRDRQGWVDRSASGFTYHIRIGYSNADGQTWQYMDTGVVRLTESGFSLSGRSTNVGPDDTGWVGHVVVQDGVAARAGRGTGDIDQTACDRLTE